MTTAHRKRKPVRAQQAKASQQTETKHNNTDPTTDCCPFGDENRPEPFINFARELIHCDGLKFDTVRAEPTEQGVRGKTQLHFAWSKNANDERKIR